MSFFRHFPIAALVWDGMLGYSGTGWEVDTGMAMLSFISSAYSPGIVDGRDVGSLDVFIPIFISYGNAHNALPSEERQRCGNSDSR